jgi:hypothetical protein
MANSTPRKTGRTKGKGDGGALYFQSLSVKNIRCFGAEEQVLNLTDKDGQPAKWTLLLGDNGTGKTTLLQCLAIPQWDVFFSMYREMYGASPPTGTMRFSPSLLEPSRSFTSEFLIRLTVTPDPDGTRRFNDSPLVEITSRRNTFNISDRITEKFKIFGYGPIRRLSTSAEEASPAAASLFNDEAMLRNPRIWLRELDYAAAKAASEKSSIAESQRAKFDMVCSVLIDLLPDVSDIRITSPTRERPEPDVEFCTCYGWVPLGGVAYGYQSLVAWVVDFASRLIDAYPDSPHPLHEPAICLVDEIDLHLHPSWQREVMSYLSERFPKTQFIATAHSPLIVQAAPTVNANVAVLRRVRGEPFDHVEIDNDPEMIRGWRLDQILASDLFSTTRGPVPLREPGLQKKIDERRRLLAKGKLTSKDRKRIQELEKEIGMLPVGETPEQIKAMQLLNESLEQLKTSTG